MTRQPRIDCVLIHWGERLFYPGNRIVSARPAPRLGSGARKPTASEIRRRIAAAVMRQ